MITRDYNKIVTLPRGRILKESADKKLADEINYYKTSTTIFPTLFPQILWSESNNETRLCMERYGYPLLADLMVEGDQSYYWSDIIVSIKEVLKLFETVVPDDKTHDRDQTFIKNQMAMYLDKTEKYYDDLRLQLGAHRLFCEDELVVNGVIYKNFFTIWHKVKQMIHSADKETMIHGDMCLSNMFYNPYVGIKLIDPRGSFGSHRGIFGDRRYDVAKLAHSFDGCYDYLIRQKFTLSKTRNYHWTFTISYSKTFVRAMEAFDELLEQLSVEHDSTYKSQIKLIQGTIFIGMCSRHYENIERQIAMYLTGVRLLNEGIAFYENSGANGGARTTIC